MRLAVHTDYAYHRVEGRVYAERAFALFLAALSKHVERLDVIGRLHPGGDEARYELADVELIPLPYYASLTHPIPALRSMIGSLGRFWRALDRVDAVWLLGPHPLSFAFAGIAIARRRKVILGIRQESVEYVRNRHRGRRRYIALARLMEAGFRLLARFLPTIVVGPRLADAYRRAPRKLEIAVSLVSRDQIAGAGTGAARDYGGELLILSVGRLDAEKNPLALADTLALLNRDGGDWRLIVCGEGPLADPLASRLAELGLSERADLRGYVRHEELADLYRSSHALLHMSWTEGLPQVLFEAFAAELPVVATDVGGIGEAAGEAVKLVPPGAVDAAARALRELVNDPSARERMIGAGRDLAETRSIEGETERVARFLVSGDPDPPTLPVADEAR